MSVPEMKAAEPLSILTPPAEPQESAWWIIAVVFGWYILGNVAAFFIGFFAAFTARAMGATLSALPNFNVLTLFMSSIAVASIFLLASLLRGRMIGEGNIGAGLSNVAVRRLPLIAILVITTAAYSLLMNLGAYSIRPDLAAQIVARPYWLHSIAFAVAVLLAPIAEEFFFRGWLWNALKERWNILLTASVVSALWIAAHWDQGIFAVAGLIPIAALLAVARHFGQSVRASLAVHIALNLAAAATPWIFVASR
jgi:membrane protease YdiL (CAAX protease family)